MDRALLMDHLEIAERHVREGRQHIARQKEIIENLHSLGQDTTTAEGLLRAFERTQEMHVADRDRIRVELGRTAD